MDLKAKGKQTHTQIPVQIQKGGVKEMQVTKAFMSHKG